MAHITPTSAENAEHLRQFVVLVDRLVQQGELPVMVYAEYTDSGIDRRYFVVGEQAYKHFVTELQSAREMVRDPSAVGWDRRINDAQPLIFSSRQIAEDTPHAHPRVGAGDYPFLLRHDRAAPVVGFTNGPLVAALYQIT